MYETTLTEFCQILVDYISLGHFGSYRYIVNGQEHRNAILRAAETAYPETAMNTDIVVSFNEKYGKTLIAELVTSLESDISHLGETLTQRNDAEDHLCAVMLY